MAVQTTYEIEHAAAVEGAVVDGQLKNVLSKAAVGIIPFGRFVVASGVVGAALPTTTGQVTGGTMLGASIRVQQAVANASDVLQFEDESDVSILDTGVVYLRTEDAVVNGDAVFVRFAAGGGGAALGSVRSDADVATAVALPGATFVAAGGAGTLVPVRVRLS